MHSSALPLRVGGTLYTFKSSRLEQSSHLRTAACVKLFSMVIVVGFQGIGRGIIQKTSLLLGFKDKFYVLTGPWEKTQAMAKFAHVSLLLLNRVSTVCAGAIYFIVGIINSAPERMPSGQRAVMVFIRVKKRHHAHEHSMVRIRNVSSHKEKNDIGTGMGTLMPTIPT